MELQPIVELVEEEVPDFLGESSRTDERSQALQDGQGGKENDDGVKDSCAHAGQDRVL